MKKGKKQILGIQFIRFIAALSIVLFHFGCHSNCFITWSIFTINGLFGGCSVGLFFMVSGYVLYLNYSKIQSIKVYYYRRWKSVFISFYIVFIFVYLLNVIDNKCIFWGPEPWKLIFSIIGIDGYLELYGISTYVLIGEWFIGPLVFVYAIYPIISKIMNRLSFSWFVILLFLSLACICVWYLDISEQYTIFKGITSQHLVFCLLEFYLGILLCKFDKFFKNPLVLAFGAIGSLLLLVITCIFNISHNCFMFVSISFCLFIWLLQVGNILLLRSCFRKVFLQIASISLPIFYLQHLIILKIFSAFNPLSFGKSLLVLLFTIAVILVLSKTLQIVNNALIECSIYKSLEIKLKLTK